MGSTHQICSFILLDGAADCRCRQNFVGNGIICTGTVKDVSLVFFHSVHVHSNY